MVDIEINAWSIDLLLIYRLNKFLFDILWSAENKPGDYKSVSFRLIKEKTEYRLLAYYRDIQNQE